MDGFVEGLVGDQNGKSCRIEDLGIYTHIYHATLYSHACVGHHAYNML